MRPKLAGDRGVGSGVRWGLSLLFFFFFFGPSLSVRVIQLLDEVVGEIDSACLYDQGNR